MFKSEKGKPSMFADDEEETEMSKLQMMKLKPNFSSHHHYKTHQHSAQHHFPCL